jgi:cyclophilin family peptidyl-prolyl cis-trans isomerase
MAQGGGYDEQFRKRSVRLPVQNESLNGLKNVRGSIAMAREDAPHSANSEFFINFVDNPALDGNESSWGYTVFGHVVEGMDVVDRMQKIPTWAGPPASGGRFPTDVPKKPIVISRTSVDAAYKPPAPKPVARPAEKPVQN